MLLKVVSYLFIQKSKHGMAVSGKAKHKQTNKLVILPEKSVLDNVLVGPGDERFLANVESLIFQVSELLCIYLAVGITCTKGILIVTDCVKNAAKGIYIVTDCAKNTAKGIYSIFIVTDCANNAAKGTSIVTDCAKNAAKGILIVTDCAVERTKGTLIIADKAKNAAKDIFLVTDCAVERSKRRISHY